MIHKKQSYLTSKYLFFPLPVAVGVSKSFLWQYKHKQEKALLWNLLGNVSCTNIHPQMVWLPSGPVSSHYITDWLTVILPTFSEQSHVFSNFPKNAAILSSGQSMWGSEPNPVNLFLSLSKTLCQATAAGRQPQSMTSCNALWSR